jgi:hypothetical protein
MLDAMFDLALRTNSRVELVVRGKKDGWMRSWLLRRTTQDFRSDRHGEIAPSLANVIAPAASGNEFTATLVPQGSGLRLGLDRDGDGYFNGSELETGFNPADPASRPGHILSISKFESNVIVTWQSFPGLRYAVESSSDLGPSNAWGIVVSSWPATTNITSYSHAAPAGDRQRFYRIRLEP